MTIDYEDFEEEFANDKSFERIERRKFDDETNDVFKPKKRKQNRDAIRKFKERQATPLSDNDND